MWTVPFIHSRPAVSLVAVGRHLGSRRPAWHTPHPRLVAAGTGGRAGSLPHHPGWMQRSAAAAAAGAPRAEAGGSGSSRASDASAAPAAAGLPAAAAGGLSARQQRGSSQARGASLSELWSLLLPDRWRLLHCATATALSVACYVCVAPCLGAVVDVISHGTQASPAALGRTLAILAAAYLGTTLGLGVQTDLALSLGEAMATRLRSRLFAALLRREALFFEEARTGQMMQWLGSDIEVLQSTVAKLLGARGLRSAAETLGIVAMLLLLSPPLAATLLLTAPLLTPAIQALSESIRGASSTAAAAAADVSAAADEVIENMRVVRVFGQQGREMARFQGLVAAAHSAALRVIHLQALLDFGSRGRNTLCVCCTLGLGAYLALAGAISTGVLYTFFVYSFSFAFALGNLTSTAAELAKALGAVSRTMATLRDVESGGGSSWQQQQQQEQERQGSSQSAGPSGQSGVTGTIPPDRLRGAIEFRGVNFRHPGGVGWTVADISFSIPAGQTVALVGPSGGGKSTIASMLVALYRPSEGDIYVDGVPLSALDIGWWRRQLGVVEQDPGLVSGRVADIIRYGRPEASQEEVEAAARAAQADVFIRGLPAGYETRIGGGEGGVQLSGGQSQRLAIARALLPRPRVLILDEATSALDVETEGRVAAALTATASGLGVTSLVVAHRLSTVRRADRVVVVAGGRVVEQGTHEELMGLAGGAYARLVRRAERRGRDSWGVRPSVDEGGGSSSGEDEESSCRDAGAAGPQLPAAVTA